MKTSRTLAVILGSALVAASLLATASSASAQTLSYVNPLATATTADTDITSLDVDYGDSTLTVTGHVENVAADYSFAAIASASPSLSASGGSAIAFGGEVSGGTITPEAESISLSGTTSLSADSVTLTRNLAAGTISASISTAALGITGPLYAGAQISSGSVTTFALRSLTATPSPNIEFFGPVLKGSVTTTTSLQLSWPNQTYKHTPASATATVSPAAADGSVQFYDGSKPLGTAVLTSAGTATFAFPSTLPSGKHKIHATFVPATPNGYLTSTSAAVPFTVISIAKKTTTKVSLSRSTQVFKKTAAKVTVKVTSKKATGKIAFYDGKKKLKTVKLEKGKASYTLPKKLKAGSHKIKAVFVPKNVEVYKASTKTVKLKVIK